MKLKPLILSFALAGVAFTVSANTNSNLVVNGDFESQSFTGWTRTGTGLNSFANFDDGHGYFWRNGTSGMTYLSQSLATVTGTAYTLSFDLKSDNKNDPKNVNNEFLVSFGSGAPVFSASNFTQGWTTLTFSGLIASTDSTVLKIGSRNTPDWNYIDKISVIRTVSPVPEPQTYAMLLAGLGLLGVAAKRRKVGLN